LLISLLTTTINIGLAIYLSRPFIEGGLEHGGLALANGIAVGIEALIGLMILRKRWGGVNGKRILIDAGKAGVAAVLMGASILAYNALVNPGPLGLLVGGVIIGGIVYFGTALLLGIEEIRTLPSALIRSFRQPQSA
jgi:peptidoglycan biosynthesis protein MviN/MurJ (putative lipid II flippase)